METMQPTLKNGRYAWDRVNMPEAEFQERARRITKAMREKKIDVLLLYGNTFNEYGNPCYVTNFVMRLQRGVLAAITRRGDVTLIFDGAPRGLPTVRKMTWAKEHRACADVSQECVKYLTEKKLIPSRVGFAGIRQFMPNQQFRFLSDALAGCTVIDADPLINEMRMVKSRKECDQIQRASRILTQAFGYLFEIPFPGTTERGVEAMLCRESRLEGAEDFRMMIGRPMQRTWAFRPAEENAFSPGETVLIYLAVAFERYWADAARTYVVKGSSLEQVQGDLLNTLYDQRLKEMAPGKSASQFYRETMAELKKAGFEYISDYGLGHGIGLGIKERPLLTDEEDTPLKEGMCLSLRLLIRDKALGAVMLGNTLRLTKKGAEVLTV
jgi:Xaa-Pro aminopeptidase